MRSQKVEPRVLPEKTTVTIDLQFYMDILIRKLCGLTGGFWEIQSGGCVIGYPWPTPGVPKNSKNFFSKISFFVHGIMYLDVQIISNMG